MLYVENHLQKFTKTPIHINIKKITQLYLKPDATFSNGTRTDQV